MGLLDVCARCRQGHPVAKASEQTALEAPVLGIDPGMHMGLGVVLGSTVLWTAQLDWRRPGRAVDLEGLVELAVKDGCRRAVLEVLGATRGAARGRATSWAVMSRTAGRAAQECERQGLELVELDSGAWREALGLPRSFGKGKAKDRTAKQYAQRLLQLTGCSGHECEAALMARAGLIGVTNPPGGVIEGTPTGRARQLDLRARSGAKTGSLSE